MDKKPFVIIAGPTAVGKTELSIALAKRVHGEIISADSMQVYKYMDIGSAKIKPEEMQGIPHYLVDELDPKTEFHVVKFQEMAHAALDTIYKHQNIPMLVGGTGFYIQALLNEIDFTEEDTDMKYRHELEQLSKEQGSAYLHQMLKAVDPASAEAIHPNNSKRVIRALEFHHLTGSKISEHNETERQKSSPYNYAYFVLTDERERLYERINDRVDLMIEHELVQEVSELKNMGCDRNFVSMQGLGYKEILEYLDGEITLEEAVYKIKRDTRHFAKRQLTWFRREPNVIWVNKADFNYDNDKILTYMLEEMKKRGIQ